MCQILMGEFKDFNKILLSWISSFSSLLGVMAVFAGSIARNILNLGLLCTNHPILAGAYDTYCPIASWDKYIL